MHISKGIWGRTLITSRRRPQMMSRSRSRSRRFIKIIPGVELMGWVKLLVRMMVIYMHLM